MGKLASKIFLRNNIFLDTETVDEVVSLSKTRAVDRQCYCYWTRQVFRSIEIGDIFQIEIWHFQQTEGLIFCQKRICSEE